MPRHFLVDTNIIVAYLQQEDPALTAFINNPQHHFYYTETVKREVNVKHADIPAVFHFYKTDLTPRRKELAYQNVITDCGLKNNDKFKADLMIIFEAGYACNSIPEIGINDDAALLTHNMKLYKKFIADEKNKEKLETIINDAGFEHLITLLRPVDVLPPPAP